MTEVASDDSLRSTKPPWFLRPFGGVWSGFGTWLGTVLTLAGLYAAYGHDSTKLLYAVGETRSPIVTAGHASELRVLYNGVAIEGDVTAAQVALWNGGQRAVEKADVLEAIHLITDPRVEILEARWRQVTRPLCRLDLDEARRKDGEIAIRFDILESRDGGSLQLVYAGGPKVAIRMVGAVKGQRQIVEPSKIRPSNVAAVAIGGIFVVLLVITTVDLIKSLRSAYFRAAFGQSLSRVPAVATALISLLMMLAILIGSLLADRWLGPARPPFQF